MIRFVQGNLLEADVEALVNAVNCVGVMGKGIALEFKKAFPANFVAYEAACKAGEMQLGRMLIVPTGQDDNPRYIINFPTKQHWRGRSPLAAIHAGLNALVDDINRLKIGSVAVPALGCGAGGLDWSIVKPFIVRAFQTLPKVAIDVYEPL